MEYGMSFHTLMRLFAHGWQRVNFFRLSSGPTFRLAFIGYFDSLID